MKLVVFGLTVSSSWGNGHATLWRALIRALGERGHEVVFFEKALPFYTPHRDLTELPHGRLRLYENWQDVFDLARAELAEADVGLVTSYCPDALIATELVTNASVPIKVFYDLDTPVTLDRARAGEAVEYIGPRGLRDFDLVLSFTGGEALTLLKTLLGAKKVAPLYGSVDTTHHHPVPRLDVYQGDLSYLGTYAENRQRALQTLFLNAARKMPHQRFTLAGAQYPQDFPWEANVFYFHHVPPPLHPAFYCSSRLTLNVTRGPMAELGYCPSGRLFEAAACGVPVLTDMWQGLELFFTPGEEILLAQSTEEVVAALSRPPQELARIGRAARERALSQHTGERRAEELVSLLNDALLPEPKPTSTDRRR